MTTTTAAVLVPEQLSQAIQSAADPPSRCGGRPYARDRAALASIIKQLHTGIPLRLLPPRQPGLPARPPPGGGCALAAQGNGKENGRPVLQVTLVRISLMVQSCTT